MYEKFLERNTNCISHTVDDGFIAQYAGIAPESLIALWKEAGLGMFCDGLFRIINPDEFQFFADEYNSDSSNKTVLPFMVTAFGDIFAYVDNSTEFKKMLVQRLNNSQQKKLLTKQVNA